MTNYSPQWLPSEPNQTPIEGESPLYIDGQRASFTLDGMSISAQQAQALMGTIGGSYTMSVSRSYMPPAIGFAGEHSFLVFAGREVTIGGVRVTKHSHSWAGRGSLRGSVRRCR